MQGSTKNFTAPRKHAAAEVPDDGAQDTLGLTLEPRDALTPWGFVAVAAHGPVDGFEPGPIDDDTITAVWKAVEDWEHLGMDVVWDTLDGKEEALKALAEGIRGLTTDPFYCVSPQSTYPIEHFDLEAELRDKLEQLIEKAVAKQAQDAVAVTPQGDAWFINPRMAVVNYQASEVGADGATYRTNSMALLKYVEDGWKLNLLSNFIWVSDD